MLKKCILNLKRLTFRKDFTYMIPVYAIFSAPLHLFKRDHAENSVRTKK